MRDSEQPPFHGSSQILDEMDNIKHQTIVVSELINILAHQSPMMPILCYDEDSGGPKYLNGIRIDETGGKPTFIFYFSEFPRKNDSIYDYQSHQERVDEQRSKAMEMTQESRRHMEMLD